MIVIALSVETVFSHVNFTISDSRICVFYYMNTDLPCR